MTLLQYVYIMYFRRFQLVEQGILLQKLYFHPVEPPEKGKVENRIVCDVKPNTT